MENHCCKSAGSLKEIVKIISEFLYQNMDNNILYTLTYLFFFNCNFLSTVLISYLSLKFTYVFLFQCFFKAALALLESTFVVALDCCFSG